MTGRGEAFPGRAVPLPSRGSLAALAPGAAAPATDRSWDFLLICVAVYLATAVGRVHQLFAFLTPLKPALVSAILASGVYIISQSGPRRFDRLKAPTTTLVVGILVWVALSVPGALNQGIAFNLLTDSFVKTVILYILIVGSVRGFADVERLALVYYGSVVMYALVVLTRFDVSGGDWRLSDLYYYDANDFATLAVSAMPLGLYFAFGQRRMVRRAIGIAGFAPLAIAFIWSGSRGGFLAMIAMVAFLLFRYTALSAKWRVFAAAAIAVVLLTTASDKYWTQMQTIFKPDQDYNRNSEAGRMKIWGRGIVYMVEHPIFGVGANNFPVAEGTISPLARRQEYGLGVKWGAAHSTFVQIGAELGFPGLLMVIAVLGSSYLALRRVTKMGNVAGRQRPPPVRLAQALTASLVGFTVGAFFLSLAYSEMLYALVGLTIALQKVGLPKGMARASHAGAARAGRNGWRA